MISPRPSNSVQPWETVVETETEGRGLGHIQTAVSKLGTKTSMQRNPKTRVRGWTGGWQWAESDWARGGERVQTLVLVEKGFLGPSVIIWWA